MINAEYVGAFEHPLLPKNKGLETPTHSADK